MAEVFGAILIYVVWLLIALLLLYWIVWRVIHDSDLAQDVKAIKEMLLEQKMNAAQAVDPALDQSTLLESEFAENQACPACGEPILVTDRTCGSCGLTLISEEEGKS